MNRSLQATRIVACGAEKVNERTARKNDPEYPIETPQKGNGRFSLRKKSGSRRSGFGREAISDASFDGKKN
jgi:hypothetical protein